MRKYYAIYDTKDNKYFIKHNDALKNNPNLCIREIAKFE